MNGVFFDKVKCACLVLELYTYNEYRILFYINERNFLVLYKIVSEHAGNAGETFASYLINNKKKAFFGKDCIDEYSRF